MRRKTKARAVDARAAISTNAENVYILGALRGGRCITLCNWTSAFPTNPADDVSPQARRVDTKPICDGQVYGHSCVNLSKGGGGALSGLAARSQRNCNIPRLPQRLRNAAKETSRGDSL